MNVITIYQERINHKLGSILPDIRQTPQRLHEAMTYAVMSGGKRIRPLFTYATGFSFEVDPAQIDNAACAIELMHCYSLVHDDLPAMDDDDFRRGKPSCHKAFDEATAILTGDALQCLAFEVLARDNNTRLINVLANACGSLGMAGGQQLDLEFKNKEATPEQIEIVHRLKTGALFSTAIELGALAAGCLDEKRLQKLRKLGATVGLIFQWQDDLADQTVEDEKIPLVNRIGVLFNQMEKLLNELEGNNSFLQELIHFLKSSITAVIQ
ncbi:polyprenyl synthetase family protein [Coxiella burnetii]|uniref:polyprenyl synthetase family protein n=1 Tax=Coxiella burnetii TaxID=777 RepID=UPI0022312DD6|nr:polyprenyl synthetase family protein [Coxiella burnetii]